MEAEQEQDSRVVDPIGEAYQALIDVSVEESMDKYQAKSKDNLSSHKFNIFSFESPRTYQAHQDGTIPAKDTVSYIQGRSAHTLILEGKGKYLSEYVTGGPVNKQTGRVFGRDTKAFKDWMKENRVDPNRLLTKEEDELNQVMKKAADENPIFVDILNEGYAERVIRAEYCGRWCQIRPDWLNPHYGMINMKTVDDLNRFERDARWKWHYFHGEAFYRSVAAAAIGDEFLELPCSYMVIEKKAPNRTALFELDFAILDQCRIQNEIQLERFKECRESGYWPTNFEGESGTGINIITTLT